MALSDASSRILAGLLETRTGQQLSVNRIWRIEMALQGLVRECGVATLDELVATIVSGRAPGLTDRAVDALLNNETSFFRDRASFNLLLQGGLERLAKARARDRRLRIWCAGCSSGQEPYSLAMAFADDAPRWRDWRIDIVGTDVSKSAIEQAREGLYSQFEVQRGLPVVQMMRWFVDEPGQRWRVRRELRDRVRFQQLSLSERAPLPGTFDILLCRNVLLYFSAARRRAAFDQLAAASAPDACLMLGAGETIIGQTEAFISDPVHRGLYLRASQSGAAARHSARQAS